MRRLSFALQLLALLATPAVAVEGESSLTAVPGFGTFNVESISGYGGVLTLQYSHAFSDTFGFRAVSGLGAYSAKSQISYSGSATVGLSYALDVLRYVPYADVSVGALVVGGGAVGTTVKPLVELGGGLEILESTSWSWGIDARISYFPNQATYFTIGPRLSWRWGYF